VRFFVSGTCVEKGRTPLTRARCSPLPRQGWGSKIIDTKQPFPRKAENLLESAQAAAAEAMSVLQQGAAGAASAAAGTKAVQKV
jgi:hypothetical protein